MADQVFTQAQLDALIAKLDAMDFTDEERSLLRAVFRAAAGEGEVEGFDMNLGSLQIFAKPTAIERDAASGQASGRRQFS